MAKMIDICATLINDLPNPVCLRHKSIIAAKCIKSFLEDNGTVTLSIITNKLFAYRTLRLRLCACWIVVNHVMRQLCKLNQFGRNIIQSLLLEDTLIKKPHILQLSHQLQQ
ncbi:Hypothetical_protein [Hexamita inflata]|uniref:Hypothetical_protein n=1 Tax=Hexamita inflata TaxID=28002 RepID=A0AA86QV73_9EUKA|nr:Hypothetical protein HINF_LOCUS8030 [Hexamita inflata]CAI9966661.1 Hypothetical protein HINF_LOCUS54306 [Hexamita inflata]